MRGKQDQNPSHAQQGVAAVNSQSARYVLFQARWPGDLVQAHEVSCFLHSLEIQPEQLAIRSLLDPLPQLAELQSYDAILIGGAGAFYVSKANLPTQPAVLDMIRTIVTHRLPMFGTCFGYQLLVEAMGGTVVLDAERVEVGTFDVTLTPEGQEDPLLRELPKTFATQMGHKDQVVALPPGYINLASSELCPQQATRVPDAPIWGVQFHPEMDERANLYRFEHYHEGYVETMDEGSRLQARDSFAPSPDASTLLKRFAALL